MLTRKGYQRLIQLALAGTLFLCVPMMYARGGEENIKTDLLKEQIKEEVRVIAEGEGADPAISEEDKTREKIRQIIREELHVEIRKIVEQEMSNLLSEKNIIPESQLDLIVGGSPPTNANIPQPKRRTGIVGKGSGVKGHGSKEIVIPAKDVSTPQKAYMDDMTGNAGKERERALEQTLVERGGMLLPQGKLQIEPSFTAAHFSSNRINIEGFSILPVLVIGEISTEEVKRDILIPALAARYGLLNNLQVDVSVPYRYEYDTVNDNLGMESVDNIHGIGDISGSVSRQLVWEEGWRPDLLASVSVKSDTGESPYNRDIGLGTGHWAVKGAIIAAKSSDPAVIFGNINYTWNIERDIADYGTMDPGDTIGYGVGAAIALSYQTAINFQWEQNITTKMKQGGREVNGSFLNSATVKTGFTWSISEHVSVDFSTSVGLTTDSPDYTVMIKIPYTF